MGMQAKRRTRNFIDSEVQGGLVMRIGGQWLLMVIANAIGLVIWIYLYEMPEAGIKKTVLEAFYRYLPFLIVSLALLPVFAWDISRTTNRFAGPISRLRNAIASAASGKPVEPLTFRDSDFWGGIASDFNKLINRNATTEQRSQS